MQQVTLLKDWSRCGIRIPAGMQIFVAPVVARDMVQKGMAEASPAGAKEVVKPKRKRKPVDADPGQSGAGSVTGDS